MMILKEKMFMFGLGISVLLAAVTFSGEKPALYASEVTPAADRIQQECQRTVKEFCQPWVNEQYETMYEALSKSAKGKMNRKEFVRTYRSSRLIEYSLTETLPEGSNVLVRVNLKFQSGVPPRITSGVHTFNMERDEGSWKIKYIMPPIKAPAIKTLPGGSNPGE